MRPLLLASLLFATACIDERDEFIGDYRTTWSTTIVRDDGAPLSFASSQAMVLVGDNGDDAVWLSAHANIGASLECGFSMLPADGSLVLEGTGAGSECTVCDELRTECWRIDLVAATGTLAGDQLTLTTSGAAHHMSVADDGTATATISGPRRL
jgi:hypothetical protein